MDLLRRKRSSLPLPGFVECPENEEEKAAALAWLKRQEFTAWHQLADAALHLAWVAAPFWIPVVLVSLAWRASR